jgi:hypothetical protein
MAAETGLVEIGWELPTRERGLWSDAFHRLSRNRLAMAALAVLILLSVTAVASQYIGGLRRYDPYQEQDYQALQEGPSRAHFFGTDNLGRDNWSRVLTGVTISLQIGLGTQLFVLFVGLAVGAAAALGGRLSDNLLMQTDGRHLRLSGPSVDHPHALRALGARLAGAGEPAHPGDAGHWHDELDHHRPVGAGPDAVAGREGLRGGGSGHGRHQLARRVPAHVA